MEWSSLSAKHLSRSFQCRGWNPRPGTCQAGSIAELHTQSLLYSLLNLCVKTCRGQRATSEVRPHIPPCLRQHLFLFLCFALLLLLLFDLRGPGWLTLSFQEPPVSGSLSYCRDNGVTDTRPCAVFYGFWGVKLRSACSRWAPFPTGPSPQPLSSYFSRLRFQTHTATIKGQIQQDFSEIQKYYRKWCKTSSNPCLQCRCNFSSW